MGGDGTVLEVNNGPAGGSSVSSPGLTYISAGQKTKTQFGVSRRERPGVEDTGGPVSDIDFWSWRHWSEARARLEIYYTLRIQSGKLQSWTLKELWRIISLISLTFTLRGNK